MMIGDCARSPLRVLLCIGPPKPCWAVEFLVLRDFDIIWPHYYVIRFITSREWVKWPDLLWRGDMSAWASKWLFCFRVSFLRASCHPSHDAESTKRPGNKLVIKRKSSPCVRKIPTVNSELLGLLLCSNPKCGTMHVHTTRTFYVIFRFKEKLKDDYFRTVVLRYKYSNFCVDKCKWYWRY